MRIAIISKTPRILDAYRHTPEELLVASGGNTGNLAFIHAVDSHIMDDKSYFDWDFDPDHLNDRFDLVFLICANMINPEIDLTELADRFDRLKLPITAASLGVQGETDDSELGVSDSCVRFLHCLSSKSSSFGVRGIRASDCLSRLGIRNFRIIGCPSNFINPDRRLGSRIFSACGDRHLISVAAHIDLLNKRDHQPVCTKLQNLCGGRRARYFVQSPGSYVDIALKSDPQFSERQIAVLTDTFGYRNDVPPLDFIQDNLRCQMSVDHWLLDMRHYDCSIGPRLHGNIVAIQAGVPSLIVCHDARTEELAGTLAIPHVGVPEFLAADSIESIFEARMGLMQKYDARRHVLAVEYLGMLLDHGITVSRAPGIDLLKRAIIAFVITLWGFPAYAVETVSVLDFGADPTGLADSAPAFRTAIQSTRRIAIPPGRYLLNSTTDAICCAMGRVAVMVQDKHDFEVVGNRVTIVVGDAIANSSAFQFDHDRNYVVEGLAIQGNRKGLGPRQENVGIMSSSAVGFRYQNIQMSGFEGLGAGFAGDWLVDGTFSDLNMIGIGIGLDLAFLKNVTIRRFRVRGGSASTPGQKAVSIIRDGPNLGSNHTGIDFDDTDGVTIEGGVTQDFVTGAAISTGTNVRLRNNTWEDSPNLESAKGIGVYVHYIPDGPFSSVGHPAGKISIDHDTFINAASYGALVEGSAVKNGDEIGPVTVDGAEFRGNTNGFGAKGHEHISSYRVSGRFVGNRRDMDTADAPTRSGDTLELEWRRRRSPE